NEAPGSEVLVVGFTDSVGSFDSNMNLSKDRARQVMEEILRAGGEDLADLSIDAEGFGELSPAACNVDNPGRRINRRVEIWIRTTAA
ncbi:MAG: OmpA family protein, partial [Pseudomonadota bacterium]